LLRFVRRRAAIAAIVASGAVLAFAYRMTLARAGRSHIRLFEGSDTHADPLLIGCSLALFISWNLLRDGRVSRLVTKCLAGLSLLTLLGLFVRARYPVDYAEHSVSTITALCTVMIIADLLGPHSLLAPMLRNWLLVRTGRVSYGLYLWHYPIFFALGIETYGPRANAWIIAAGWVATVGISLVSFAVVEKPALRLKARIAPVCTGEPIAT
jgi:peptidoglycan/LPS O-acetylase OafA/YrhL